MTDFQMDILRLAAAGETVDVRGDDDRAHELEELVAAGYVVATRVDNGHIPLDYFVSRSTIKGREALEAPERERRAESERQRQRRFDNWLAVACAVLASMGGCMAGVVGPLVQDHLGRHACKDVSCGPEQKGHKERASQHQPFVSGEECFHTNSASSCRVSCERKPERAPSEQQPHAEARRADEKFAVE